MTPSPTHKHEASKEQGILSDEIVEKAARAIYEAMPLAGWSWDPNSKISGSYRAAARAALTAVLPKIIEECAKAVEEAPRTSIMKRYHAAVIRNLIPKDSSNG